MKKKTVIAWSLAIFVLGILCLVLLYHYGGFGFAGETQGWVRQAYGVPPIEISTPVALSSADLMGNAPADMEKFIKEAQTFIFTPDQGLQVLLNSVEYQPEVNLNPEGAADGAIYTLRNQQGVNDLKYEEEPVEINGLGGKLLNGTYQKAGQVYAFRNLLFNSDTHIWQLTLIYPDENQAAAQAAERIQQSIQIPSLSESR